VNRRVELPRSSRAPCSKPKLGPLYSWWPSIDSWCVTIVESPVSYLELTVPTAACEIAVIFQSTSYACVAYLSAEPKARRAIDFSITISMRVACISKARRIGNDDYITAI
jgi:hypothetical protein